MVLLSIVGIVVFWLAMGWVSMCVRLGTWSKTTIVALMYADYDNWGYGRLQLLWEMGTASLCGPIVVIKYLWMRWRNGTTIGFRIPTRKAWAEVFPY